MADIEDLTLTGHGGIPLRVRTFGARGNPAILAMHGWPELGLSWYGHAERLAARGHFVIVPDLRGFGGSGKPREVAAYGIDALVGDGVSLLDHFGYDRAIWAGHDWGGIIVWHAAMLMPGRVSGVISVNTPHFDLPPAAPTDVLRQRYGEAHYIVAFQREGVGKLFDARPHDFFRLMLQRVDKPAPDDPRRVPAFIFDLVARLADYDPATTPPPIVGEDIIAQFVKAYAEGGFEPTLNLYRNMDANHARMTGVSRIIHAPALMVTAANDWFLPPNFTLGMERLVPNVTVRNIADCGHWTMWEKPEELGAILQDWLTGHRA